jgi:hypothetical protein
MSRNSAQHRPEPVGSRHRDASMSEPSHAASSPAGPADADPLAQVTKARAAWLNTTTTILAEHPRVVGYGWSMSSMSSVSAAPGPDAGTGRATAGMRRRPAALRPTRPASISRCGCCGSPGNLASTRMFEEQSPTTTLDWLQEQTHATATRLRAQRG